MIRLSRQGERLVVPVRVQPGASREAVGGERAGSLRVAVSAAPEQGKANQAVVEALASALGLRRSGVEVLSGQTGREKRVAISLEAARAGRLSAAELARRIGEVAGVEVQLEE